MLWVRLKLFGILSIGTALLGDGYFINSFLSCINKIRQNGKHMRRLAVVIHPNDNVAVALKDLKKGQKVLINVGGKRVKVALLDDIPFGHKFALKDIDQGGSIIKYGEIIGRGTKPVKAGEHVHVHNVESLRGRGDWAKKKGVE